MDKRNSIDLEVYKKYIIDYIHPKDPKNNYWYFLNHQVQIRRAANFIKKNFKTEIKTLYRGVVLEKLKTRGEDDFLKPRREAATLSFSESYVVAHTFADLNSLETTFVRENFRNPTGYIMEYKPRISEILYHYKWIRMLSTLGDGLKADGISIEEQELQKEVLTYNISKKLRLKQV